MYKTIMVPVDLAHADQLDKALATAADLAKHYGAKLYAVGVTASAPSSVAHNPKEYTEKLQKFAEEQSALHGVDIEAKSMLSNDPAVDVDFALQAASADLGADLIVMASHVPGFTDYIFASRAGYLAAHSELSVFVVR